MTIESKLREIALQYKLLSEKYPLQGRDAQFMALAEVALASKEMAMAYAMDTHYPDTVRFNKAWSKLQEVMGED